MLTILIKQGDKLFQVCEACRGLGKERIWTNSSNSPGMYEGRTTKKICLSCDGSGLDETTEIKIITKQEFDKNRKKGMY